MAIMKKYFFPLEKLYLVLFYFSPFLTFTTTEELIFHLAAVAILVLSYVFERARLYTPLLVLILILSWFQCHLIMMAVVVLAGLLMAFILYYKVPNLGKSGYKKWQKGDIQIGVFYPTKDKKGETVKWVPDGRYDKVLYQIFFVDPLQPRVPFWLFKFITSYTHIIDMPVLGNAKYSGNLSDPAPVVLFSHGLGSNLTNYTSMHGYLASQGYIVVSLQHHHDRICVDHREQCGHDHIKIERMLFRERNTYLKIRVKEMKELYNLITEGNILQQVLEQQNFKMGKIFFGGHSYGAATVLETYANLIQEEKGVSRESSGAKQFVTSVNNLTSSSTSISPLNKSVRNTISGLFLLDPWYFPLSESTYSGCDNPNMLILHSHTFFEKVPYLYYLEQKFHRIRLANPSLIALMLRNTDHLNPSDATFVFGNLLQYTKSITHHKLSLAVLQLYNVMIKEWLGGANQEKIEERAGEITRKYDLEKYGVWVEEDNRDTEEVPNRKKEF